MFVALALKGFLALGLFVLVRAIASCVWRMIPDGKLKDALFKERYS